MDHQHHKSSDAHAHHQHDHHDHHKMMIEDFKKRFWASLILTIPVLLLSPMIQQWLGLDWQFSGDKYLLFALSSILFFYGVLRLASALEANSEHPIAEGIMKKVKELGIKTPNANNFRAITGKGVEATVDGSSIKVVSPGYLSEHHISIPDAAQNDGSETIVFVLIF